MTENVEKVAYQQVYDLVFRARNDRLDSAAYSLDYYDWIRAGIAFNTRGYDLSTRKISYFARLYKIISEVRERGIDSATEHKDFLAESLILFYEDIFSIYQDYLRSKHIAAGAKRSKERPSFGELLILPSFDEVPFMRELFETETYAYNGYECANEEKFVELANSAYIVKGTGLFSCMSLSYDYGIGRKGLGVLVEVELWQQSE